MKKIVALLALAALLILGGVIEGARPLYFVNVPCGSGFGGTTADQLYVQPGAGAVELCAHRRTLAAVSAAGALAAGCVIGVAGLLAAGRRRRTGVSLA